MASLSVVEAFGIIVVALKRDEGIPINLEQLQQQLGEDQCRDLLRALGVHGVFARPSGEAPASLEYLWTRGTKSRMADLWTLAEQLGSYAAHYEYCCNLLQSQSHLLQPAENFGRQLIEEGMKL